jgi:proteic killer suppression protein
MADDQKLQGPVDEGFLRRRECQEVLGFKKAAERKLVMLDSAVKLGDLASSPGNRLEKLSGDRAGQYSIRINDQWRICFT